MTVNVSKPRQVAYADQVCNPNMIINWNFQNIINQRGQLEYPKRVTWDKVFDCWVKTTESSITLNYENGIYSVEKVEILMGAHALLYDFEPDTFKMGEYYTLTLEVTNINGIILLNFEGLGWGMQIKEGVNVFTLRKEEGSGRIFIYGHDKASFKPIGIKVERGTVSTYKNEVFNYAETLRKCQRYYLRLTAHADRICYVGLCQAYNTSYAIINLPYDLRMHTPTVTHGGNFYLTPVTFTAPTRLLVTSIGVNGSAPEGKGVVLLVYADGIIDGTVYKLIFEPGGYIDFSAEYNL